MWSVMASMTASGSSRCSGVRPRASMVLVVENVKAAVRALMTWSFLAAILASSGSPSVVVTSDFMPEILMKALHCTSQVSHSSACVEMSNLSAMAVLRRKCSGFCWSPMLSSGSASSFGSGSWSGSAPPFGSGSGCGSWSGWGSGSWLGWGPPLGSGSG